MKILILSSEFPPGPGGIGTHAFELAEGLTAASDQVRVLSAQDYTSREERKAFNSRQKFDILTLASRRSQAAGGLSRLRSLYRAVHGWQPDVCIATGARSVWLMALVQLALKRPWLAVGHGSEFSLPANWERRFTRWSFNQAPFCVAVSQFTRRQMNEAGIQRADIQVIPNGANPVFSELISADEGVKIRGNFGFKPEHKLLLTVGNLTRRKGQDIVIRALPEVARKGWDVHYWIVGLPTLQSELAELALHLGVQDRVHFAGRLSGEQLVQAYQVCDIFLMTSRFTEGGDYEGYGIAAVEASLSGKPVIVSRSGGLPEAVEDQETGMVVPENDPESTARAVLSLLETPALARRLGAEGRRRALSESLWVQRVDQYRRLLVQMVSP